MAMWCRGHNHREHCEMVDCSLQVSTADCCGRVVAARTGRVFVSVSAAARPLFRAKCCEGRMDAIGL